MNNLISRFVIVQKGVTFILALVIPLIVVVQVVLRYVFKAPLMGIEELLLFPTIWLYMLGGANASQERTHIECGILTLYIKKDKSIKIFNLAKGIFSLLVSLWLTYWSYWLFSYSLKLWKTSDMLYIPTFFAESSIFIGLVLMSFYTLLELIEYTKCFVKGTN